MDSAHGLAVPRTLEEACDPAHLALLVYDMQAGVLGQIDGGGRVLAGVQDALVAARETDARVLFVRHVTLPTRLMGAAQLRMWRTWQGSGSAADVASPFPPDAPGSRLADGLVPGPDEAVFDKVTMSAFEGTPLDIVLRDCGVTTVALCGVALEIGLDLTARHAADLGYVPVLIDDACGAGDSLAGARARETLAFAGDTLFTDVAGFAAALRS